MAVVGHFVGPKFTFDGISDHFRSIRNFFFILFVQMAGGAILDVRNSLSIAFFFAKWLPSAILDSISGHFKLIRNWFFLQNGYFVCSKITFDCISGHFRSIGHFGCLKCTFDSNSGISDRHRILFSVGILDIRKSLSIAFLIDRPFWMSEIHFRWYGWDDNINHRTRPRYLDE